jgi:hypothetical protein
MATVKAESFEETFKKLVALFDSGNAGEAENAFRKAVLLCAKNGLRFCDAAALAFGQSDGGEVAELQDRLRQQEAQHANQLTEAAEVVQRLRGEVAELSDNAEGDRPHDFKGWFRHAWEGPQFRLVRLTLMIAAGITAAGIAEQKHRLYPSAARFLFIVTLYLFGSWSVALCRRYGFTQMLMKWVVYCSVVAVGCMALPPSPALLVVLLVAMVLTLSRLSEWLGENVRANVWESNPVHVVRDWF